MRDGARLFIRSVCLAALISFAGSVAALAEAPLPTGLKASELAAKMQTTLGLYVTAAEAAEALKTRNDVVLIDVRTPEETMFVGYPEAASANIPLKMVDPAYKLNTKKGTYALAPNKSFAADVKAFMETAKAKEAKIVLMMCRSGSRSAKAVDAVAKQAGMKNVYSVVDGFEGDKGENGLRDVNGWKNSGAAWTTKIRDGYWFRSQPPE